MKSEPILKSFVNSNKEHFSNKRIKFNISYSFFYFFKYFFLYIERNNLVCLSKLGSFKCKFNFNFLLYVYNSLFLFKLLLLNSFSLSSTLNKKKTLNKILFNSFISLFIISILNGFRGKFKIVGRGYKLHKKNNNLVFKLGYSHLIFKTLDLSIFLKKKEKKKLFYTFRKIEHCFDGL